MRKAIGIVFGRFDESAKEVLSYLLVYQNTLQKTFEFRILSAPDDDPFFEMLSKDSPPYHDAVYPQIKEFLSRLKSWNRTEANSFRLEEVKVDKVVVLTDTTFSDNFYYVGDETWAVIALGGWESEYAPPSIVEYYLSFVAVAAVDAIADIRRHFETRGCICDFNCSLSDARLKVLTGYICETCASSIQGGASGHALADAELLMKRDWLGSSSAPADVALTVKKLGYDLFRTSGIKPTLRERCLAILEQEGLKNLLSISFQILLGIAVLVFGLSNVFSKLPK
jgi:hypothetical protein